jgi:predicted RNA binding protein YcfA (HicA-like mRNA interferase family)
VTRGLPEVSGARLKRALERAGFVEIHTRGSHCKLRHPTSRRTVIVPMHGRVRPGTLSSISNMPGSPGMNCVTSYRLPRWVVGWLVRVG